MISTQHLTADQLTQLEALLADTTTGGGVYRPPVARDVEVLRDLEHAGLSRFTIDCGYEITQAGRAVVVDHVKDIADAQAFVMYAPDEDLRESIAALKLEAARYLDGDGNADLRERVLADIEACQDALDTRACDRHPAQLVDSPALPTRDSGTHLDHCPVEPECVLGLNHFGLCRNARDIAAREARRPVEGPAETSGRHHLVEPDDRPTQVIPPVQEQTAPMPSVGTLPGLPVVESDGIPCDPDEQATIRLIAALRATPTPAELAEVAAAQTAGWKALEADLGDERSWLRRNLTPPRVLVLSVTASIVVTWFVTWLVMA